MTDLPLDSSRTMEPGDAPVQSRAGGPRQTDAPMPREAVLARTFVALADTLVADFDLVEVLTMLADRCVDVLDAGAAGVLLAGPHGQLVVVATSDEATRTVELFEVEAQLGPSADCLASGQPASCVDLAGAGARWPAFTPKALVAGYRSVHSLPMRLRERVIGALTLFHPDRGEMRPADHEIAQALADVATIAILQHRESTEAQMLNQQLNQALTSRVVIEQAKGMVAERRGLGVDEAFTLLRSHARGHNRRLADVARDVIAGALPPSELAPAPARGDR